MTGGKNQLWKGKRRINWAFLISPATLTNRRRFKHFCYCYVFFSVLIPLWHNFKQVVQVHRGRHLLVFQNRGVGREQVVQKRTDIWKYANLENWVLNRFLCLSTSDHCSNVSQRDRLQSKPGEASFLLPSNDCFNYMPHARVTWPPNPSPIGSIDCAPFKVNIGHETCVSSTLILCLCNFSSCHLRLGVIDNWNLGDHTRMWMACRDPQTIKRAMITAKSTG